MNILHLCLSCFHISLLFMFISKIYAMIITLSVLMKLKMLIIKTLDKYSICDFILYSIHNSGYVALENIHTHSRRFECMLCANNTNILYKCTYSCQTYYK